MATLLPEGKQSFTNSAGAPLVGGKLYTYDAGTSNPRATYQDAAGTVPNANPIVLDARGEATIFWNGSYKVVLKDSLDATIWTVDGITTPEVAGAAATLQANLAASNDVAKGAGQVGFDWALNYAVNTIGWGGRTSAGHTNILRYIPPSEWPALFNGTSTYDILAIFNTARTNNDSLFFPAGAHFFTSGPLVMNKEGFEIFGGSRTTTIIDQLPSFVGVATVNVNGGRLQGIFNMHVRGGVATTSDAIRVTDGQMLTIENVMVKVGVAGVRLISGNCQRWTNVYAESNTTGFLVIPDAGDNTNGCVMMGLRAYSNTSYGLDIQQGAGAAGHMHSTWDISTESNGLGVRIRKGRYCKYTLYSEGNTGANFDLDPSVPHFYFLKNPNGSSDGALFSDASYAVGFDGLGGNLNQDLGQARYRITQQVFSASASLAGVGVGTYYVTNTSGGTKNMTLSFLNYVPVGWKCEIIKTDNTAGLTPVAPGGITLVGITATFGAFVAAGSAATLRVCKIDAATAVLY